MHIKKVELIPDLDNAVRMLVQAAFDQASGILAAHRDTLERGAQQLLKQETLTERELDALEQALPIAAVHAEPPAGGQ